MLRYVTLPILSIFAIVSNGLLTQHPSAAVVPQSPPVTAMLPSDVAGVLLVDTTAEAWGRFNRFNPLPEEISGPPGLPYLPAQVNFSEHVQSWIGKRAAIVLMPGSTSETTPETSTLLLAAIEEQEEFNSFLNRVKAARVGQELRELQYKGVSIWEWPARTPPEPSPMDAPKEGSAKPFRSRRLASSANSSAFGLKGAKSILVAAPEAEGDKPVLLPNPDSVPSVSRPGWAVVALPGGYAAMSATPDPLKRLVDGWNGEGSLASNPSFQKTLRHPNFARSLVVGYVNLARVEDLNLSSSSLARLGYFPFPVQSVTALATAFKSLAGTASTADGFLWIQSQGIQGEANIHYATPQPAIAELFPPNPSQALVQIPAASYLSISGHQFGQGWNSLIETANIDPSLNAAIAGTQQFVRELTGLDIEQDVVPWLDGEYALFSFPTNRGLFNVPTKTNFGLGLTLQTSDRPAAEAALAKLDQFARSISKEGIRVSNRQIEGQTVVSWEAREPQTRQQVSIFARGWVNENTLVLTSGAGPLEELLPKPYLSLTQAANFSTATRTLPATNQGYFYVNVGSVLTLVNNTIFADLQGTPNPFWDSLQQGIGRIRSFSATSTATPEKIQFNGLMILAPNRPL